MYRERAAAIAGSFVWVNEVIEADAAHRVLPDGCLDLLWIGGRLVVAGPDTTARLVAGAAGTVVGLRFAPGTGPVVLGVPANRLTDQRIPLSALWRGHQVRRLAERVAEAADPGTALEEIAAASLRGRDTPADRLVSAVVAGLSAGRSVAAVADEVGLSDRQLYRRSLAAFGYGPKTLARVFRMRRALVAARSGTGLAEVAATTGYADQAHLSREVRALAGVALTQLLG
ncbi:MAG: helix-turn-helix domain-containing protein [Kutzneria sp.]|nr:helix-turn-helix domain-containing protein [Kutzneria sp.]